MSKTANEKFYDTEIAPILLELAKKCQEKEMNFLASVEYEPKEIADTIALRENASFEFRLGVMAAQAKGNVDALYFALKRYADEFGHSSVVLHMLGSKEEASR